MRVLAYAKAHPYATGAIVIGGCVVGFVILTAGGGAGSSGSAPSKSDAQIAAEANIAVAQMQTGAQTAAINADVMKANIQAGSSKLETESAMTVALKQLETQLKATELSSATQLQALNIQTNAATQQLGIQASAMTQQTQINADLARGQTDAMLDAMTIQATSAATALQATITGDVQKAAIQGNVDIVRIDSATDISLAQIAGATVLGGQQYDYLTTVSNNEYLSDKAYVDGQVLISSQETAAQVATNQANNKTERRKSDNGLFGNIIGGIASIFSDERLKGDIRQVGVTTTGLGVYEYRKLYDNGAWDIGVLAQEALQLNPQAVREIAGYYAVDYRQLH